VSTQPSGSDSGRCDVRSTSVAQAYTKSILLPIQFGYNCIQKTGALNAKVPIPPAPALALGQDTSFAEEDDPDGTFKSRRPAYGAHLAALEGFANTGPEAMHRLEADGLLCTTATASPSAARSPDIIDLYSAGSARVGSNRCRIGRNNMLLTPRWPRSH